MNTIKMTIKHYDYEILENIVRMTETETGRHVEDIQFENEAEAREFLISEFITAFLNADEEYQRNLAGLRNILL